MPIVDFDTRDAANRVRDLPAVSQHLAPTDDRRTTTVTLAAGTPESVLERVRGAAVRTQQPDRSAAGMAELSAGERQTLKRQHPGFSWQEHGFAAMRTKAALQRAGVREWMDHFEPGEPAGSALEELRRSKSQAANTGARTAVETGRRTDEEEVTGTRRERKQAEQFHDEQRDRAKDAALVGGEPDAQAFIREELGFGADFDISYGRTDRYGRPDPFGADVERLEQFHDSRSDRSQRQDERLAAPLTRDPIKWRNNPGEFDFPGVDVIDPKAVHAARSERAQLVDEARDAPLASSVADWADDPDHLDLPGIDAGEDIMARREDPT